MIRLSAMYRIAAMALFMPACLDALARGHVGAAVGFIVLALILGALLGPFLE